MIAASETLGKPIEGGVQEETGRKKPALTVTRGGYML
jgi:hypothetical protein